MNLNLITKLSGFCAAFVLMTFMPNILSATHVVGGEMKYKSLGGDTYELTLTMRYDCGDDVHSEFDTVPDYVHVHAYTVGGDYLQSVGIVKMDRLSLDTVPVNIDAGCLEQYGLICYTEAVFRTQLWLKPGEFITENGIEFLDEWVLAYSTCCREETDNTILDETGSVHKVRIDPISFDGGNQSADFVDHTPIYICVNDPFTMDHSATDEDADSLSYGLFTPFGMDMQQNFANPWEIDIFDEIQWLEPTYEENNMLGANTPLAIDAITGQLTADPGIVGEFWISVMVNEWREGELINTVYRDMIVHVVTCNDVPIAGFDVPEFNCDGLTVEFTNTSTDANFYEWFFDYPDDLSQTSDEVDPIWTYDEPGIYTVHLSAYADSICRDTISKTIVVSDFDIDPEFDQENPICFDSVYVILTDVTVVGGSPIVGYEWIIEHDGGEITGDESSIEFVFYETTETTVTFRVFDSLGCFQEIVEEITFNVLNLEFAGEDSVRVCEGIGGEILVNGNEDFDYIWTPEDGLDLTQPWNPIANPENSTTYYVTVSDGFCEVEDSIYVFVIKEEGSIVIEIVEMNCLGEFELCATNTEDANTVWSDDPDFVNIIGMGDCIEYTVDENQTIYARIDTGVFECIVVDTFIDLENPDIEGEINVDIENSGTLGDGSGDTEDDPLTVCQGEVLKLLLEGDLSGDTLEIVWGPEECIVSGQGSTCVEIETETMECTEIYVFIENEFGCLDTVEFFIVYDTFPDLEAMAITECGNLTVDFTLDNPSVADVMWVFGDGEMSMEQEPTHTYEESGIYTVIVTSKGVCPSSDTLMVQVNDILDNVDLPEVIMACHGDTITLNGPCNSDYVYEWLPAEKFEDNTVPCPTIIAMDTCEITVMITDPNDPFCTVEDTISLQVMPSIGLTIEALGDTSLCEPEEVQITAMTDNPDVEIIWYDQDGNQVGMGDTITVLPLDTTCYYAVASDTAGCMQSTEGIDEVCIDVVGEFEYAITVEAAASTICRGDTTSITIIDMDDNQDFEYMWGPEECIVGDTEVDMIDVNPSNTKDFIVTITDPNSGCEIMDTVPINVNFIECDVYAELDTIIENNNEPEDNAILYGCGEQYEYVWETIDGEEQGMGNVVDIEDPLVTTVYSVTITDPETGCVTTDTVPVVVLQNVCSDGGIFVPNVITPNGDGTNDVLDVQTIFIRDFLMIIYDRWGEEVFRTETDDFHWDGSHNNEMSGPDVYGYYIEATCYDNEVFIQKGNITVIR